jgi:protein involved in polysaccharide export with SLBB domain
MRLTSRLGRILINCLDGNFFEDVEMTTRMHRSMIVAGGTAALAIFLIVLTTPGADGPAKSDGAQIRAGDRLFLHVVDALPKQPIKGVYRVELSGKVPLGFVYGRVQVAGLTPEAAEKRVQEQLATLIKNPVVSLAWYDPVAHGEPALRERVSKLESELAELRAAVEKLRKP